MFTRRWHPLHGLVALVVWVGVWAHAQPASADYSPPPIYDMIAASDLIAVGSITALTDKTYTFKVERLLAGSRSVDEVEVQRFTDWTCAQRWAPYQVGQRMILFADRQDDYPPPYRGAGEYRARSAGNEGEMELRDGQVVVRGFPALGLSESKAAGEQVVSLERWIGIIEEVRARYVLERTFDPKSGALRLKRPPKFEGARPRDAVAARIVGMIEERTWW